MPKPIRLKPIKERDSFVLNVPAILSPTGRRHRPRFDTLEGAKLYASSLRAQQHNLRIQDEHFPEFLRIDALKAIEVLKAINEKATLLDAANLYAANHLEQQHSITFAKLFDLFLGLKNDRSKAYLYELRLTKNRLLEFHNQRVCDIQASALEAYLTKLPPGARNAVMRYLRAIFNVGVRRRYMKTNPIDELEFAKRLRKEVEILRPEDFQAMLECAMRDKRKSEK